MFWYIIMYLKGMAPCLVLQFLGCINKTYKNAKSSVVFGLMQFSWFLFQSCLFHLDRCWKSRYLTLSV